MKLNTTLLQFRTAVLFALSLFFFTPATYAASVIATTPCDALYYESLSARAWLEAQREITQNQNIILKPDSVLEYTCFDRLVRELADHADEMLSETSSYGSPLNSSSMDNALQNLVGTSLSAYISNNFNHNFLAGHTAAAGLDHTPLAITNATAYSCDRMRLVWNAAKCINFISNSTTDGFFTFAEYAAAVDKRVLPTACTPINANWTANLASALTSGPWTNDPLQTYFNLVQPQDCTGANCPCTGSPIPTGVQVVRSGYNNNNYQEHICLQPGCRYHPGGGDDLAVGVADPGAGCYGR